MKVKKFIHPGWKEWHAAPKSYRQMMHKKFRTDLDGYFGKFIYFYSSKMGEIDIVMLKNYYKDGKDFWEIFCQKGRLFSDCRRFDTKEKATEQIRKYLKFNIISWILNRTWKRIWRKQ